jgi:hypothetical protein
MCPPIASPPHLLDVILDPPSRSAWALLLLGANCLASGFAMVSWWRSLPAGPGRRRKIAALVVTSVSVLTGLFLVLGVVDPWHVAMRAWSERSSALLSASGCSTASLDRRYLTGVEAYDSLLGVGVALVGVGFLYPSALRLLSYLLSARRAM